MGSIKVSMKFIAKVGDIVILDEGKHYLVLNCLEMEGKAYLVVRRMKMSLESVLQLDNQEKEIVQELIDENNEYYFQFVKDEEVVSKIKQILALEEKEEN